MTKKILLRYFEFYHRLLKNVWQFSFEKFKVSMKLGLFRHNLFKNLGH